MATTAERTAREAAFGEARSGALFAPLTMVPDVADTVVAAEPMVGVGTG